MMGYISHELKQPLATLTEHLENARDFLRSLESQAAMGTGPGALAAGAVAGTAGGAGAVDPALRGAVVQIDKARTCLELLNTVSGDITNLRNIELGRMALVVEVVDVADVIQQVRRNVARFLLGQGTRHKAQDARCKALGPRCKAQGTRHKAQGTRCKGQGNGCMAQGARCTSHVATPFVRPLCLGTR